MLKRLIPKLPSLMKNFVGIESRVEKVMSQIGLGLNDVRYIGIWGMGGISKTTIARAVYETIRSTFQVTCFLADVRDQCEKKGIVHIQKQLLDQMHIGSYAVYNEYDGRARIQNSLRLKKVLLVLDDINNEKQLENLAGEQDWFGFGSRVIITTRDIHLLKQQDVHEIYNVEGLVKSEASNLFFSKAFKRPEPIEGFLDLSEEVVDYCNGLPLALKVLGSYLKGRPIAVWHSAIEKIKKSSHHEIIDVLKVSYDGLDSMKKNIFLDIACFFIGWRKDEVTKILKGCGHNAEIGIDILINRSLVTLEESWLGDVILGMHDLLEEMGTQIVIQEFPDSNDASKRSRLWDIDSLLAQNQGIEATHGIVLKYSFGLDSLGWRDLSFSNICRLKLLILDGVETLGLCNIPCTLKVFRWRNCPMETLPFADDQRYELVEIDLSDSKIVQLWDGKKFLNKLEHLNLFYCQRLKQTPDLSGAPNLKTLDLSDSGIVQLWDGKKCLNKLEHLNLSGCHSLKQTPDLSGAPNLKTLNLGDCLDLNYIHPSLTQHKSLVELNLKQCRSLETLGDKLEMSSLKELNLDSSGLRRLPEFGECMKQLSILTLSCIHKLKVPKTIVNLVGLSEVGFGDCDFTGVTLSHGCFVGPKKLTFIRCSGLSCVLYSCPGLESLTVYAGSLLGSLSHLTSLTSLSLIRCSFDKYEEPTPFCDLAHLALLTDLDLSSNHFLRVPFNIHELPRLTRLNLSVCCQLEVLPELPSSLRELHAEHCYSLDASNVNDVVSTACCAFAESSAQDGEDVLQMVIQGVEIPAWFEHQEEGDTVSVSFLHNFPSTKTMALALCFFLLEHEDIIEEAKPVLICNSKELGSQILFELSSDYSVGRDLLIVCLNSYYFSNLLSCEPNFIQMLFPHNNLVKRCGARWVCKQDGSLLPLHPDYTSTSEMS